MERKTAIITGALLVIATAASLVQTSLTSSILAAPDYLAIASSSWNQVAAGALFGFMAAACSASIAISLYPVLRKYHEGLALGAVGFRLIEAVSYIVGVISLLLLLTESREFVNAGSPAASYFGTFGHLVRAAGDLADFVFGAISFSLGALMYYSIFYRSKLIPRWLSAWGLLGALLLLSASLWTLFDGEPFSISGNLIFLVLPIALQEMVLAVWLIAKGFNPAAGMEIAANRMATA